MKPLTDLPLFEPLPRHQHPNSAAAYAQEKANLSRRALAVLVDVRQNGPGTDREIAARMGYAHRSAVQPRISELVELGLLQETGRRFCQETGKRVRIVGFATPAQLTP